MLSQINVCNKILNDKLIIISEISSHITSLISKYFIGEYFK